MVWKWYLEWHMLLNELENHIRALRSSGERWGVLVVTLCNRSIFQSDSSFFTDRCNLSLIDKIPNTQLKRLYMINLNKTHSYMTQPVTWGCMYQITVRSYPFISVKWKVEAHITTLQARTSTNSANTTNQLNEPNLLN